MKTIFSLFFVLLVFYANAQDYAPFPLKHAQWIYYSDIEGYQQWELYKFNGDTTIDNNLYHIINRKDWYAPQSKPSILSDIYLREENKKIYIKSNLSDSIEQLLYNFNLTINDSFIIDNLDTFLIIDDFYENNQRKLTLESIHELYLGTKIYDTWVEGQGSARNFLGPDVFGTLMCFENDNENTQTNCDYVLNQILGKNNIKESKLERFVYPNPTSDFIYLFVNVVDYSSYEIYDINGQLIVSDKLFKNSIDVKCLPAGYYLLQIISEHQRINYKFEKINNR